MTPSAQRFGLIETINDNNIIVHLTTAFEDEPEFPKQVTIVNHHLDTNARAYALGRVFIQNPHS